MRRHRTSWSGCGRCTSGLQRRAVSRSGERRSFSAIRISRARGRPMLELYHWEPNGSALKALIALNEKALPFRSHYVEVPAVFPVASRETQLNLEGEGPVLVHDGRQITESLFLMEYLEDAF